MRDGFIGFSQCQKIHAQGSVDSGEIGLQLKSLFENLNRLLKSPLSVSHQAKIQKGFSQVRGQRDSSLKISSSLVHLTLLKCLKACPEVLQCLVALPQYLLGLVD